MSDTVPTDRRRAVYERDGVLCVVSTRDCSGERTIQHRANRGMGGSKLRDGAENLLTMCSVHNTRLEQDAQFAVLGRRLGWKLESWEDAFAVAVFSPAWGGWRLLDGAGGFVVCRARDIGEREALDADRYAGWREQ